MMTHDIRARVALASAALAALTMAGCSSGNPINTGPFGNGYSPGSICGPASPGGFVTDGMEDLDNKGSSVAVVEKVALHDAQNLVIEAAWVVPNYNVPDFGFFQGFPRRHLPHGSKWSQRVKAIGARVPPAPGSHTRNLVLVLKLTGKKGTAKNVDVFYKEAGQQYHLRYKFSIEVVQAPTC